MADCKHCGEDMGNTEGIDFCCKKCTDEGKAWELNTSIGKYKNANPKEVTVVNNILFAFAIIFALPFFVLSGIGRTSNIVIECIHKMFLSIVKRWFIYRIGGKE